MLIDQNFIRKLFLLFLLASIFFDLGCARRKRNTNTQAVPVSTSMEQLTRSGFKEPLRVVVSNLDSTPPVLQEDADNLRSFLIQRMDQQELFDLKEDPDAVQSFSRKTLLEDGLQLRNLSRKYQVEALLTGVLHQFYYQRTRGAFVISIDLELKAYNTWDGSQFYASRRNVTKRFRVRGSRIRDFSSYNLKALNDLLSILMSDFYAQFEEVVDRQKERHGGVIPSKPKAGLVGSGPFRADQLLYFYLWPVNESGEERFRPQPIVIKQPSQSPEESMTPQSFEEPEQLIAKTVQQSFEQTKERESAPAASTGPRRVDIARKAIEEPPQPTRVAKKIPEKLDMQLKSLQLIYPDRFESGKNYQKFYYLRSKAGSTSAGPLDTASKDTVVVEVFSTMNRLAVTRFLEDYFHGLEANPKLQIPAAFERNYMGKYQIGFVLGDKAVVFAGDKQLRKLLEGSANEFYVKNGGVSIQNILDDSLQQRELLANMVVKKPEGLGTNSRSMSSSSYKPTQTKERDIEVRRTSTPAQSVQKPSVATPVRKSKVENSLNHSYSKQEDNARMYEERVSSKVQQLAKSESRQYPKPTRSEDERLDESAAKPRESQTRVSRKSAQIKASGAKKIPANAVFFFDMARRYLSSGDDDSAQRYFLLAQQKGYPEAELNPYLDKLQRRLVPTSEVALIPARNMEIPEERVTKGSGELPRLIYEEIDHRNWRPEASKSASNNDSRSLGLTSRWRAVQEQSAALSSKAENGGYGESRNPAQVTLPGLAQAASGMQRSAQQASVDQGRGDKSNTVEYGASRMPVGGNENFKAKPRSYREVQDSPVQSITEGFQKKEPLASKDKELNQFYLELEKMEKELNRYLKPKSQLSTKANNGSSQSLSQILFQILMLFALVLFTVSLFSSQRMSRD